jgi:hypothetical protein
MPGGRARTAAAVVLAAAVGDFVGAYVGLPALLKDDEITRRDIEQSVAEAFGSFVADCDFGTPAEGNCLVTRSDGRTEIYGVTVNHEGCWFAQRTQSGGPVSALPTGPPVRRGCAD